MVWQSPVKTIQICFYETGHIIEHYVTADDPDAIKRLAQLLRETNAVIVGLEDLTEEDVQFLQNEERLGERPLFAAPECYGHWESSSRQHCARTCRLRSVGCERTVKK